MPGLNGLERTDNISNNDLLLVEKSGKTKSILYKDLVKGINTETEIITDSELSTTSHNPIQNRVVATKLNEIEEKNVEQDLKISKKQEALIPGKNITIKNNVINATPGLNVELDLISEQHMTNGEYEISKSIDDYDALYVAGWSNDSGNNEWTTSIILKQDYYTGNIRIGQTLLNFISSERISISNQNNTSIDKIYGINFVSSNSSTESQIKIKDLEQAEEIKNDDLIVIDKSDGTKSITYKNFIKKIPSGGGGSIEVDDELSETSENPVQNKVVKAQFDTLDTQKQDALTAGENIILENNVISADPNIYIGNVPTNYSTEEKTIGTWTDGKPLYQKTILLNSIVFGSYQYIQLDSAVEAKRIEGVIYRTNNRADNLDNYGVDDYYKHSISVRPSGIEYNISSIYADGWKSMMITIQYTKTSDSATTVPVGDASYYTTDERIVGRWIDGKPLYQKTLVLNSEKEIGNTWDWTSIGISAGDIDFYISAKAYNSAGIFWNVNAATISGYIAIQTERNMDTITVKYITIQYTKTTD